MQPLAVIRAMWLAMRATFTMENLKPLMMLFLVFCVSQLRADPTIPTVDSLEGSKELTVISVKFFPTFMIITAASSLRSTHSSAHTSAEA